MSATSKPPIRVVVVEDSLTVRERLVEILRADPEIDVVATASDGQRATELCRIHRPDVVTLDIVMPVMDGLAATEHIMAHSPTPILIVSASLNRGELFKTYDALRAGAVEVLDKPNGGDHADWERRFLHTVKLVARIKVITHLRARLSPRPRPLTRPHPTSSATSRKVIAIGASTGGPGALVEVVRAIPANANVTVLIVLHIGDQFASAFASWLEAQTKHPTALARDGEPVVRPELGKTRVLVAPAGHHLRVRSGRVALGDDPERHACRPSVDVLFESVAADLGSAAVACLLTGMGRDGALGMLAVRRAGGATIAQDEETCVVFGMPREAILLGAAEQVLPLGDIGRALTALVEGQREQSP